jgi:hypothetical protein
MVSLLAQFGYCMLPFPLPACGRLPAGFAAAA